MNTGQRTAAIARLMSISVADFEQDIARYHDTQLLLDLLIECHEKHHLSRDVAVRRRIKHLIELGQKREQLGPHK